MYWVTIRFKTGDPDIAVVAHSEVVRQLRSEKKEGLDIDKITLEIKPARKKTKK